MDKLDVTIELWKSEVEEQEIELIERGIAPCNAHEIAVSLIGNRRRKKYADKSGS